MACVTVPNSGSYLEPERRSGAAKEVTGEPSAPAVILWYGFRILATNISPCCCGDVNTSETTICSSLVPHRVCLECARKFGEVEVNVQAQYHFLHHV